MDHRPPPASALAGFIAWRLMDLDAREPAAEIPWEQLMEATVETAALGMAARVRSPRLALPTARKRVNCRTAESCSSSSQFEPSVLSPQVKQVSRNSVGNDCGHEGVRIETRSGATGSEPHLRKVRVR